MVTFSYKDYADQNIMKTMCVTAVEFIRRYMLHILPDGFTRIRQYGFLGNKVKKNNLGTIRSILVGLKEPMEIKMSVEKNEKTKQALCCPLCKKSVLNITSEVAPVIRRGLANVVND